MCEINYQPGRKFAPKRTPPRRTHCKSRHGTSLFATPPPPVGAVFARWPPGAHGCLAVAVPRVVQSRGASSDRWPALVLSLSLSFSLFLSRVSVCVCFGADEASYNYYILFTRDKENPPGRERKLNQWVGEGRGGCKEGGTGCVISKSLIHEGDREKYRPNHPLFSPYQPTAPPPFTPLSRWGGGAVCVCVCA